MMPKEEKIHILWAFLLAYVKVEGCLSRRETRQLFCFYFYDLCDC